MTQNTLIFVQILYLFLLAATAYFQRKELVLHYKDVFKAVGITIIVPLFFVAYAHFFPATIDDNSTYFFLWFPGIPILQALAYGFCLYAYKPVRLFMAIFFIGETAAIFYSYFIYSMVVSGEFI